MLDAARCFYLDFLLAHPQILMERVEVISKQTGEVSQRLISADLGRVSNSRNRRPSSSSPPMELQQGIP
jgi:hypothetical protein